VLLILDGLRPDAIDRFDLHHLKRIRQAGAFTDRGVTVDPSITTAALTSLFTGVTPDVHRVRTDRISIPRGVDGLDLMPKRISEASYPVSAFRTELPLLMRGIASRIVRQLGVDDAKFVGTDAPGVLMTARRTLSAQRRGLIILHWPDADRAGHDQGWMSEEYGSAAYRMDATLGLLMVLTEVPRDPGTLLIVCSDHGGGGVDARNHDSAHPDDRTILIGFFGQRVQPQRLPDGVSLLDIPPTILWSLGIPVPQSYSGSVLRDLSLRSREPEPAAA
jgi:predicted AlkP superfamily pyrophosphatase or phosphodiesterase